MNILINRTIFNFSLQLKKAKARRFMDAQKKRPDIFTPTDKKI